MSFEQSYINARANNKREIMSMVYKRIMAVQQRAKIKPSEFNPVLLNSPKQMLGGDAMASGESLDLYYPSSSNLTGGGYWTDRFDEVAPATQASPEAIRQVRDELKAKMQNLLPSTLTLGLDTRKHELILEAIKKLRQMVLKEAEKKKKEDSFFKVNELLPPVPPVLPPSRRRQYIDQQAQQAAQQAPEPARGPASGVGFS